ncbi:TROVE domain-containing protein [Prescottella agglutinans]|uniref:TROVE domain-containing protein n=1 Tax=Prescottella agglutinans TaxID=1644129 RepID=A0A438BG40_9NOCA|nr:TROVE domain-containing protein [Prescottella agglutinans]RVW09998.1 TROVE domain-containing protein [Prescottella agglutinans]
MSRFDATTTRPSETGRTHTEMTPDGRTHDGGSWRSTDPRTELYLLTVTNLVREDTFPEAGATHDDRYRQLVRQLSVSDPEWVAGFLRWLRSDAHMRSAALVGAAEFTRARLDAGEHGYSRQVVGSVLQRADEPGEMLAYWRATFGRKLPQPIKRGVADAVAKLYTERALLKYDTPSHGYRFGDVLDLVHPAPRSDQQADLFTHALDRRHGRDREIPPTLETVQARADLMAVPVPDRPLLLTAPAVAPRFGPAAMTWEAVAGWLQTPLDRRTWEALIPRMGYIGLLSNLRNFDEAGVSDDVASNVAERLQDPEQVARSRQLPLRLLSACNSVRSVRWSAALERALELSLDRVPRLSGRTLVLLDTAGRDRSAHRRDAATVFGLALARRAERADVVSFGTAGGVFPMHPGESLIGTVHRWAAAGHLRGDGTDTAPATAEFFDGHDRVVVLTDAQAADGAPRDPGSVLPEHIPVYTFNSTGCRTDRTADGPNRFAFGEPTDACFGMLPIIESGRAGTWPWVGRY